MKAQENQYFQSEEKSCKGVVYVVDALISSTKNAFKVNQNNSPKFWVGVGQGELPVFDNLCSMQKVTQKLEKNINTIKGE